MTAYGIPGTNTQTITGGGTEPGYVAMKYERPTMDHLAKADGTWELSAARLMQMAKIRLNDDFEAAMADLQKPWPDAEAQTWTFQAEEARQWIAAPADAKPATPFLSSLHAQREALGWEGALEDLVKRVIHNTTVYTAATASLIGRRHVAEAAIEAAEDPSTVTWDFNLTEPVEG